ncbi:MAG TPA: hypothetical protein VL737_00390 [Candidatus Pristimantibacillus sp.]|nr:hypothetical protein [Candidatus Pristimantibacillus sp.]
MDSNSDQPQAMGLPQPIVAGGEPDVQAAPGAAPAPGMTPMTQSAPAGSDDDIDREWVDRAREIVEKTKGDPFAQSQELSKFKAEYLKNRHNRDTKAGEGHA